MDVRTCTHSIHVYLNLHASTVHTYRISIIIGEKDNKYSFTIVCCGCSWKPEPKYFCSWEMIQIEETCLFPMSIIIHPQRNVIVTGYDLGLPTLGVRIPNAHRHLRRECCPEWHNMFQPSVFPWSSLIQFWEAWQRWVKKPGPRIIHQHESWPLIRQ